MCICVAGGQERRGERNGPSSPALGSYISESRLQCKAS